MSLKSGDYRNTVKQIEESIVVLVEKDVVVSELIEDLSGSVIDFKTEFVDLSAEFQDLSAQVNSVPVYENNKTLPRSHPYTSANAEEELVGSISLLEGKYVIQIENRCVFPQNGVNPVNTLIYATYEGGTSTRLGYVSQTINQLPSDINGVDLNDIMIISVDSDMDVDFKLRIFGGLEDGGEFLNSIILVFLKL